MYNSSCALTQINGLKRNLPLTLGNGSLHLYQSGSSVFLSTAFGLALQYDWIHHLHIEVAPELHGLVCGLCGNAAEPTASNDTETQSADFTLQWVVNGDKGSCTEDCGYGVSCPMCIQSQPRPFLHLREKPFMSGCFLLQRRDGPFADCHSLVDPEPFVNSCVNNLCIKEAASSMCKILTAYTNICQRLGARVQYWRAIANCCESKNIYLMMTYNPEKC